MPTSMKHRVRDMSADRPVIAAIGISAVISALYFALALGIRGEEIAAALWQSLFCFAAVTALMLVAHWIRRAGRTPSG